MIYDPDVERRAPEEQYRADGEQYRRQVEYLFAHSTFYRERLRRAGFRHSAAVGPLERIADLPFTEKDDLRKTQADSPPFGAHLASDPRRLVRVYSSSGTTGTPCYIGLTPQDLEMYATNVARGYTAAGFRKEQRVAVGFNAGPFVAGAVYYGFDKIGCNVIPVGTGNTERLVSALQNLGATGPRIRCIGRTDDMLIVRGVNLYPTALRCVLHAFRPQVGEAFRIRPRAHGVSQPSPLPICVELGADTAVAAPGLSEQIAAQIKERLLISAEVTLVAYGSLPRDTYKAKLVDYSQAVPPSRAG